MNAPRSLILWGQAMAAGAGQPQRIQVSIDDHLLQTIGRPDRQPARSIIELPAGLDLHGPIRLGFRIFQPAEPVQRGINGDTRPLGLWLEAIEFGGIS